MSQNPIKPCQWLRTPWNQSFSLKKKIFWKMVLCRMSGSSKNMQIELLIHFFTDIIFGRHPCLSLKVPTLLVSIDIVWKQVCFFAFLCVCEGVAGWGFVIRKILFSWRFQNHPPSLFLHLMWSSDSDYCVVPFTFGKQGFRVVGLKGFICF